MLRRKLLLVAMGLMGTTLNVSIAQGVDNLTVQRPPKPLSPRPGHMPPPTRPAPPLPSPAPSEEAPLSHEPAGQVPTPSSSKLPPFKKFFSRKTQNPKSQQASTMLSLEEEKKPEAQHNLSEKLLKAQMDMIQETMKQVNVCYQMGRETARKAAVNPDKFDAQRAEDALFPTKYESIFDNVPVNQNEITSTKIDTTKVDKEKFMFNLMEQKKTTATTLSSILKKILSWKDTSDEAIKKYRFDISEDLRGLSSFCALPLRTLEEAIKYRKENPKERKAKPSILSHVKAKVFGKKN